MVAVQKCIFATQLTQAMMPNILLRKIHNQRGFVAIVYYFGLMQKFI